MADSRDGYFTAQGGAWALEGMGWVAAMTKVKLEQLEEMDMMSWSDA